MDSSHAGQAEQATPATPAIQATQTTPENMANAQRLEEISAPGAYVCHWNGDLLRVAEGPVSEAPPRLIPQESDDEPRYVTLISENPFIPLSRARMIAANLDLEISC